MKKTRFTNIQMVDLVNQYQKIKPEVDQAIAEVLDSARFIKGPKVEQFEQNLSDYLNVNHVISCANGTDALQLSLMALDLKPGDEVIVPAFTYVATAEVIALLNLKPVMVDVDRATFNLRVEDFEQQITDKTKAIVPVHLFGQSCDMESIMQFATKNNLIVIEDNAQAIGSDCFTSSGPKKAGTLGHIGTTSFFPSKNLGCYGDGGAVFTQNEEIAFTIRKLANHGQSERYYHDLVGVNSRLDSLQAVVLNIKLKHLDEYCRARQRVADKYDKAFQDIDQLKPPFRDAKTTHVFHQYTLIVKEGLRNELTKYLDSTSVPSMIYYPVPLYKQKAFAHYYSKDFSLANTEYLCNSVLSLPIHTEMNPDVQEFIIDTVKEFFRRG